MMKTKGCICLKWGEGMKNYTNDRIEGDKIVIFDKDAKGPYTLKKVEIITPTGKKAYVIKKTRKGGYLFN